MVDPGPTLGARLALLPARLLTPTGFDELAGAVEPPVEGCIKPNWSGRSIGST